MPFQKGQSGNPYGRKCAADLVNPKSVRDGVNELKQKKRKAKLKLFNQFGGLNQKALKYFHEVLDDENGENGKFSEQAKIKVATLVAVKYAEIMKDLDQGVDDLDDDKKEDSKPLVSFDVQAPVEKRLS